MDKVRTKCSMVLFAIEQELASFIKKNCQSTLDLPSGPLKKIALRFGNVDASSLTIDEVLASSYFEEVIVLAEQVGKSSSAKEDLSRLKRYVESLDFYEIRNAIAH